MLTQPFCAGLGTSAAKHGAVEQPGDGLPEAGRAPSQVRLYRRRFQHLSTILRLWESWHMMCICICIYVHTHTHTHTLCVCACVLSTFISVFQATHLCLTLIHSSVLQASEGMTSTEIGSKRSFQLRGSPRCEEMFHEALEDADHSLSLDQSKENIKACFLRG